MAVSHTRLLLTAAGVSLLLVVAGFVREGARFGVGGDPGARLEREVTARVAERTRLVESTATRVARQGSLVAAAAASRDRLGRPAAVVDPSLPKLFAALDGPIEAGIEPVSATVWIQTGTGATYVPLAWTDGPTEDLPASRLEKAPSLFVSTGASGLRLVALRPIDHEGKRVGIAAAETRLSSSPAGSGLTERYAIGTSLGDIPLEPYDPARSETGPGEYTIASPAAVPLLRIHVPPDQVVSARRAARWGLFGVAAIPWLACAVIALAALLERRREPATWSRWIGWTAAIAVTALATAGVALWVFARIGLSAVWSEAALALVLFLFAAIAPVSWWCVSRPLRIGARRGAWYVVEHLVAGAVIAAGVFATAWLWQTRISPLSIDQWHLPVLPSNIPVAVGLMSLLLVQIAIAWAVAGVVGAFAARWRVSWRRTSSLAAIILWSAPTALAVLIVRPIDARTLGSAATLLGSAVMFGLLANSIRRHYRRTGEARRLVLQFCALVAPVLLAYPLASASADRATREVIQQEYGPATQEAQQPNRLMETLTSAWADLDDVQNLPSLIDQGGGAANSSQLAFQIWDQTVLSKERVTSQIELYGRSGAIVSKFSLNVPEFAALPQSGEQKLPTSACEWDAFGEVARFGAVQRRMLHAERALCNSRGEILGAIVIRIIPDYRTLPFVTSASPYPDALSRRESPRSANRIPELQVAVYGWSMDPLFVSGRVMWPLDQELSTRLYQSRDPFWVDRTIDDRTYHVYFLSDRGGIYAVGYPEAAPLQHAARLSESAAILALLFITYLAGTVAAAPLVRRRSAPLERLFTEIRTSFNRKLFLFFLVAAVLPVILFAIAFGTYMTAKLRADVESEAGTVVLMARRVLDELSAAQTPVGQSRPAPTDDEMVWIRQVVDQDVNLFEGPILHATSQRDLFDSGLLPTRTPASVYRLIALEGRPVAVVDDQIGDFRYQVAAVPVPNIGPETVLTVPLASRQREIERQTDELTRGVLTGAVVLVLFAAALGASVAGRVSDPVARLTRATRLVAAGRFDERLVADTSDELGRLVGDFNKMIEMLVAQRAELARTNQLRAWAEMSRQVAHEIKNPLTPIQLAAEHLQRVHDDASKPLGPVVEQCLTTILKQVSLLRRIASEFSTFAVQPTPRIEPVDVGRVLRNVVEPYQMTLPATTRIVMEIADRLPLVPCDRTLLSRAFTNLVENAVQAMPSGGLLRIVAEHAGGIIEIRLIDTGVGMDAESVRRAFEPYFSTKTAGSGLGLANAKRNIEICGGTVTIASQPNEGTTATVTLPTERPAASATA